MEYKWEVKKAEPHWLDADLSMDGLNGKSPAYSAGVKFDGCIHFNLRRHYNGQNDADNTDYIHICDIDEMIEVLRSLKELAMTHFGEEETCRLINAWQKENRT